MKFSEKDNAFYRQGFVFIKSLLANTCQQLSLIHILFGTALITPPQKMPPTEQNSAPQQRTEPQSKQSAPMHNGGTEEAPIYEIKKIKVEQSDKGMRSSMILEGKGNKYNAFFNGCDERLKSGTKLVNIKAQTGKNSYGTYVVLNSYDIAA